MGRQLVDPARIWRHLYEQGGWHTHQEVCAALGLDDGHLRASVSGSLLAMGRRGAVRMRIDRHGERVYGVTAACKPPGGIDGYDAGAAGLDRGGADPVHAVGVRA